ncbi:ATP12 family chaperone protein [Ancylobacter oerskovii]|uniref:ATP12 family chaperone protein n=1 Tax=Ancylobacter oerskovii TaxID=459519 RepID=A0ABW4Z347_9HYPH|nr:ATP12 family protein [Ancylobacter oerskovii]MBS7546108.1 ATPase [Ancylobacter oerskovii]
MSLGNAAAPIKRFYKEVGTAAGPAGFQVQLDGRPVRTPGRNPLALASEALAREVAAEWAAQGETLDPLSMPLTRLVNSALDGVVAAKEEVGAEVVRYAGSDLVCYRAEGPARLVALQAELWDPVLAFAQERLDARFRLAEGVMPVAQPPEALDAIRASLPDEPLRLAALNLMTVLSGSALISLAVLHGRLTADEAWRAAHIDEEVQEQAWGTDHEAELRRQARWRDFRAAARLLELVGAA